MPKESLRTQVEKLHIAPDKIQFITDYDSTQARAYLKSHAVLALMPSTGDNSPCVIYECMADGIPFIVSSMGGQPELIASEDHAFSLALPYPEAFAEVLEQRLRDNDSRVARPATAVKNALQDTIAFIEAEVSKARMQQVRSVPDEKPLVSIIIPTFNRAKKLPQALQSALAQDYPYIEVVIVNDGSTDDNVLPLLDTIAASDNRVHVIHQENKYLGAARNAGVCHANGEYVLFLDDDNSLVPHAISTCVKLMLRAKVDAVVVAVLLTDQDEIVHKHYPLACGSIDLPSAGLLSNIYGDACGMVRKEVCLKFPFAECHKIGHEDWHFWANLVHQGKKILPLPELLLHYRISENSMLHTTSKYRNFMLPAELWRDAGRSECVALADYAFFA